MAPAFAKTVATCRPMPDAAPVTTAVLPASEKGIADAEVGGCEREHRADYAHALGSASQARRTHPLCTLASDTMALKADPMDDERFDGMYLQVAQTIGGIDPLLDSFFGFLRRKTDFFAGAADPAKARETVLAAFEKNKERSDEELKEKAAKEKKRKADEEKRRARLAEEKAKVQKQEESRIEELTPEEAAALKAGGAAASSAPAPRRRRTRRRRRGRRGRGRGGEGRAADQQRRDLPELHVDAEPAGPAGSCRCRRGRRRRCSRSRSSRRS